jgi:hypothetical protein
MIFVPRPARVTMPLTCLGVRFCASSMMTQFFWIDRPRMMAMASVVM